MMIPGRSLAPGGAPCALSALDGMFPVATEELIAERQLLRRIDSKYVVPARALFDLLGGLDGAYAALRGARGVLARYSSLYLDTLDLRCFHDHRRGKRIRHKVRIRHYDDRALSFFEIKTKRNDTVTDKHRLAVPYRIEELLPTSLAFVREHGGALADALAPVARIDYRRISLVSLADNERVTIDVDLEVANPEGPAEPLIPVAVIEVKQAKLSQTSPMLRRLASAGYRERSFSKYIAAITRLRPHERKNRLLPTLRGVERLAR